MYLPKLFPPHVQKLSFQRGQADILILVILMVAGLFLAGSFSEFTPTDPSQVPKGQQEIIGVNPNDPTNGNGSGNGNGNGSGNETGGGNNGGGNNGSGNSTGNTTKGNGNTIPQDHDLQLQLKTFRVNSCSSTHAVYLLVDNSGSMKFGTPSKISALKNALTSFGPTLQPNDAIALETFSDPPAITRVPLSLYAAVSNQFVSQVQSMVASGATYMKDGFTTALGNIQAAQQDPKFRGYKFVLILLTDGIPESSDEKVGDCFNFTPEEINDFKSSHGGQAPSGQRCFAHGQDPTDVATQIKSMGVDIYTIAVIDEGDNDFNNLLIPLMKRVATQPTSPYFVSTFRPEEITNIYKQIGQQICK